MSPALHQQRSPGDRYNRKASLSVFAVLFAIGIAWSVFTQHVWEDFYITYRASKNLATGHGFTFTAGERVHSYTSPLGALLPALANVMVGNKSDDAALWVFRLMSISAFAGAGVVVWKLGRRLFATTFPAVLLVALFASDSKTIDFTTNGMEAPYVLLFLAWTLTALYLDVPNRAVQLGLAWAGLMWSRPDSFIYIGALGIGALIFKPAGAFWAGRWALLKEFCVAGSITTLCYGPWLLWAWWYYGSPIPHTVIAKGLLREPMTVARFVDHLADFPTRIVTTGASLATTFMPPYGVTTGWAPWAVSASFYLAVLALILWVLPFVRWEARVASLAFGVGHFYLNYFAGFHSPWYVPTLTTLAIVAIVMVVSQLCDRAISRRRTSRTEAGEARLSAPLWLVIPISVLPIAAAVLAGFAAFQMKMSQTISETGNRRVLGEWLKAQSATPRDTVLLEPLGYIGFFSGLKMYDFPGLSSPEVVAARRKLPRKGNYSTYFPDLIAMLQPNWVVLRDTEVSQVEELDPELLTKYYKLARVFDVRDRIAAVPFLPGRGYLEFDGHFEVYRRNDDVEGVPLSKHFAPRRVTVDDLLSRQAWGEPAYNAHGYIAAHAPSSISTKVPLGATKLSGKFGFFAGAHKTLQDSTEGAEFVVDLVWADGRRNRLFAAVLDPRNRLEDRGDQSFTVDMPTVEGAVVEFVATPRAAQGNAYCWTYWRSLQFDVAKPSVE